MTSHVAELLRPYGPSLAMPQLVEEVNRVFHEIEAPHYDRRHLELREEWPSHWREMLHTLGPAPPQGWRVLDFGCGTGFASQQVLDRLGRESVGALTCYDLSPEMVRCCRQKIGSWFPDARFTARWEEIVGGAPYNLLATNALLHHLPDPLGTIRDLLPLLSADAVWTAGHEPSCRFYQNPTCFAHLERYKADQKRGRPWRLLRRSANVSSWFRRLRRRTSPKAQTAREVTRRGLFQHEPPAQLIDRLVDLHVAHSPGEAQAGRGFDFHELARSLRGEWRLAWVKTCAYMGTLFEGGLPEKWQAACRQLAGEFPDDGATFCTVWRREHRLGELSPDPSRS